MNIRFSKGEKRLLQALSDMDKPHVSLDEIVDHYEDNEDVKINNLRSTLAARMRHVEWKGHRLSKPMVLKTTQIGRGNKAEYDIRLKNIRDELNQG